MEPAHTRENNSSPYPTEDLATPLIQEDPYLVTLNGGEGGAKDPAWPSTSPPAVNFHHADKSQSSSLQLLHPKLTSLKFELPRSKPLFERLSFS